MAWFDWILGRRKPDLRGRVLLRTKTEERNPAADEEKGFQTLREIEADEAERLRKRREKSDKKAKSLFGKIEQEEEARVRHGSGGRKLAKEDIEDFLEGPARGRSDRKAKKLFDKILTEEELTKEDQDFPIIGGEAIPQDEQDFLDGKTVENFQSSNVKWFAYSQPESQLTVSYKDGSVYAYQNISVDDAIGLYRSGSKGSWVWDNLRVRGTVFGYKKPYVLLSSFGKQRIWMGTQESRLRHGEIGPEGERFKGYHPLLNPFQAPERGKE